MTMADLTLPLERRDAAAYDEFEANLACACAFELGMRHEALMRELARLVRFVCLVAEDPNVLELDCADVVDAEWSRIRGAR